MPNITATRLPAARRTSTGIRTFRDPGAVEPLYDRMLRIGYFEIPEARSLSDALRSLRGDNNAPGSSARFYSPAENVISQLSLPAVSTYPVEFSLTRLRNSEEWILRKGSRNEVLFWPSRRHDHIGVFDLALHNHDEDWALPSPTDLKTMVYTRNLGIRYALIGQKGLTAYTGLPSLNSTGFYRFLKEETAHPAAEANNCGPLEVKRRLIDKMLLFGWIGIEHIHYSDTEKIRHIFDQE